MSIDSPSSEPRNPLREKIYQILGAGTLMLSVGCQSPATEEGGSKDTTRNPLPVKVGVSRYGRPRLKLRIPGNHKDKSAPTTAATKPETANPEGGCTVKGNISSKGKKLYHIAGACPDYEAVKINKKGEQCFKTEAEAREAGWQKAGNCS